MSIGLVCDTCDALSPMNAEKCVACDAPLNAKATKSSADGGMQRCPGCAGDVPPGNRFCGTCGTRMERRASPTPPPATGERRSSTSFFGVMQAPGRAKLILIKGEGLDGVSYVLSATEHIAGRAEGSILFQDDPLLSPRHANFYYRDGRLNVRDEGSQNGVFLRITDPIDLQADTTFLVGEQLLRVAGCTTTTGPFCGPDGTYFYGSPRKPSKLQLIQLLEGGGGGIVARAAFDTLTIGREGNDLNFPDDPFISGKHAQVKAVDTPAGPRFRLSDSGSKNGTFVRIVKESPLSHGDYVFLGRQLLRVEIN